MLKFILRRLAMLIPVLLGVSFLVFTIMSLTPGDPVEMYLGDNYTHEAHAAMTHELGLDKPFFVRYLNYIGNAVQGNFGISYSTHQPVLAEIEARFPSTVILAISALIFAIVLGVLLGTISAAKQYSAFDSASTFAALIGVSMPNFWLGLMLIIVFAAGLGWFPSSEFSGVKSLVLPAIALGTNSLAIITRMTRSSLLETIRQDYIRTARAKGVKEYKVIIKHALRNAMIPIITISGLQFGFAISGAVVVETVFSWPGIGRLLVETIKLKDMPVVLAIVLIIAVSFTVINLIADILYAFFDPRIRAQYKTKKV
ncbi:ABC transporter permease [Neobacillus massiliamazoniensis]|jgi:peptide/nickel transport system permease protein|uniref:Peptide ABC transporter permease n=1 Tax=Neobacillus massiliamazoniensis TaxID=1499688 RepID=A0A0U1NYI9_9BACI|nr:ABC transporter permease [Neobacillus massiliamazoniensis]CRK83100.1 peptide ABC transporter permease [Neobacillus massiliamazoniensis]